MVTTWVTTLGMYQNRKTLWWFAFWFPFKTSPNKRFCFDCCLLGGCFSRWDLVPKGSSWSEINVEKLPNWEPFQVVLACFLGCLGEMPRGMPEGMPQGMPTSPNPSQTLLTCELARKDPSPFLSLDLTDGEATRQIP